MRIKRRKGKGKKELFRESYNYEQTQTKKNEMNTNPTNKISLF